jgi:hypothetical protein
MMLTPCIDDAFIKAWHPRYDLTEHDECDYQKILVELAGELLSGVIMSRGTCQRIYRWKAARAFARVDWDRFDERYAPSLRNAFSAPRERKLDCLVGLPGLRAPTASTLLHFMHPDVMPIFDRRTATVLFAAGLTAVNSTEAQHYWGFCNVIDGVQRRCPGWTLRQIDRALFAYHKQNAAIEVLGRVDDGPPEAPRANVTSAPSSLRRG